MKVVGYASSNRIKSLERSFEIKFQKEKIEDFCNKQGLILLKIYEEPQESRPDYKPVLRELINDSTKGTFEKILVIKFNILGSDNTLKSWVTDELKKADVDLFSITESVFLNNNSISGDNNKAKSIKEKVRDIPSLPEVVTRVMELVQDPNSSAAQLGNIISHRTPD